MKKKHFLLFLCFILPFLSFAQDPTAAEDLVAQGIELHDKGEYSAAVEKYEKALSLDKENYYALFEMSMTKLTMGEFKESIEYCKRLIALDLEKESMGAVYDNYATALDGLKRKEEAIKMYDEGIRLYPKYHMLHFNKGICLAQSEELEDASFEFQKTIKIEPRHASSHNALARVEAGQGNRIAGLLAFFRFFVLEPEGQRAAINRELTLKLMADGVEKTGKKNVSLKIDGDFFGDTLPDGSPDENSFATVEIVLMANSAMDFDKKYKKDSEREKFLRKFNSICDVLAEGKENNFGFFWEYYAAYFIEMKAKNQTDTYSYLFYASDTENSEVQKWIKSNTAKIKEFYEWSSSYQW